MDKNDRDHGVLENKRDATRYLILVEVANRQPAVSQKEIAESVGVTAQAVSDYLRGLVDDGYVEKHGRGRYETTKEGIDWLMSQTDSLRSLTEYVSEEVVEEIDLEAAVAADDVEEGQAVSVQMRDGFMHASPGGEGGMSAVAVTEAEEGEAVGITEFEGVLDYEKGDVTVLSVPKVGEDETEVVVPQDVSSYGIVVSSGIEAVVALRKSGTEPDICFGTEAVVEEAATRGVDVFLAVVEDRLSRHIDVLREAKISYEVITSE